MFAPHRQIRRRLLMAVAAGSGLLWSGIGTALPAHAQEPDPATELYVSSIMVSWTRTTGTGKKSVAIVDIVDGNGTPVNGALVVGDWSGCFRMRDVSDTTETVCSIPGFDFNTCVDGRAVIWGKKMSCPKKQCAFTFTITDVRKDGMTYVPVEGKTSSLITCSTFGSTMYRGTQATWASNRKVVTREQQTSTRRVARWSRR